MSNTFFKANVYKRYKRFNRIHEIDHIIVPKNLLSFIENYLVANESLIYSDYSAIKTTF